MLRKTSDFGNTISSPAVSIVSFVELEVAEIGDADGEQCLLPEQTPPLAKIERSRAQRLIAKRMKMQLFRREF
jgi:hypothetical protein